MNVREFKTPTKGVPLTFTELGFGTAPLGDLFERLKERQAFDALSAAYDTGVRLFDTSPHYGNGLAEARCGIALRQFPRESFLLSTKVGRWMNPFEKAGGANPDVYSPGFAGGAPHKANFDYSYDGVMKSVEQSLLRIGTDSLDILLIHDVDVWTHGDEFPQRFKEAMAGAYKALDKLRADRSVKAIGVGINEAEVCEQFVRAGDFDVVLMASQYSLIQQPALKSFLPLALEKGVGIMMGGVFNSGILATGAVPGAKFNYKDAPPEIMDKVRRIETICQSHDVPLRRVAMRFALSHPAVVSLVLGGVAAKEVQANAADIDKAVPAGLWSDLKREGLLAADAPTPN